MKFLLTLFFAFILLTSSSQQVTDVNHNIINIKDYGIYVDHGFVGGFENYVNSLYYNYPDYRPNIDFRWSTTSKINVNSTGWVSGSLTGLNNDQIDSGFEFNFDYLAQQLFFKQKDSSKVSIANQEKVSYFSVNTDRTHYYVRAAEYLVENKNDYFEILAIDPYKYSFFKLYKPGHAAQTYTYYVFYNNSLQEIKLSKEDILRTLPSQEQKIKDYLNANSHQKVDETYVTRLIKYLNT